ncbi:hypothetical protein K488DRAFT_39889 [Vararia minispora EC-137]|uniref:Uncharacterized protein n=1 Tax=Vararia minispora EC-137 TaxID=1314806 RepID=A0ACB8QYV8_9AGAM|nr:hypothetical protein K488DRAFT_39889 [Vararia minispora EC-137]
MRSFSLFFVQVFLASSAFIVFSTATTMGPCSQISGSIFSPIPDLLACLKSFPFNETLRQNVLSVVSRTFDFYTFESYYLDLPAPFQESTTDIRQELSRINATQYATDYDFNKDLYQFINSLNDGHTQWLPNCYVIWENLLPIPIVSLEVNGTQNVYVVPDAVQFVDLIPNGFEEFYSNLGIDWATLAGALVTSIEGMDPYTYVDHIADTVSGNFLDHGVRVNSVFSSYRLSGSSWSQKFGDFAGRLFSSTENVTLTVVPNGLAAEETVTIPFLAARMGGSAFEDSASYWANNCAAGDGTNGVDRRTGSNEPSGRTTSTPSRLQFRGAGRAPADGIGLPATLQPTLPELGDNTAVLKVYTLPDNETGVIFVGSFDDASDSEFQNDVVAAIQVLQSAGVTRLLIDLTNNLVGGVICQGIFFHSYLAGSDFGYAGFQGAIQANQLAQEIVTEDIADQLPVDLSFYPPAQWLFVNGTALLDNFNYVVPDLTEKVNGVADSFSIRLEDMCPFYVPIPASPPFELRYALFYANGNCASTCAQFATNMYERHNTTIAVFGGKPGLDMEYKGMAGYQVLVWTDLDSEIKTAGLKGDPLAPPDLHVGYSYMRHNWRTAYSWLDEKTPIAFRSELPQLRFPYTKDTYMNPQNIWTYASVPP